MEPIDRQYAGLEAIEADGKRIGAREGIRASRPEETGLICEYTVETAPDECGASETGASAMSSNGCPMPYRRPPAWNTRSSISNSGAKFDTKTFGALALGALALILPLRSVHATECVRLEPLPACAKVQVEKRYGSSYYTTMVRLIMTNDCDHEVIYNSDHYRSDWEHVQFATPAGDSGYRFYHVGDNQLKIRTRVRRCVR